MLRADPVYRRKRIIAYLGAVFLGTALIQWGLPAFESCLIGLAPKDAANFIWVTFAALALPMFGGAVHVFFHARRIFASGQSPPPGTKVIIDTPVLDGSQARSHGIRLHAASLVLMICAVALGLVFPKYVSDTLGQSGTKLVPDRIPSMATTPKSERNPR